MRVIQKLQQAGYTLRQIADGAKVSPTAVGMYRRGDRFPSRKTFVCFVEMAEAKGVTLLARDFLDPSDTCDT